MSTRFKNIVALLIVGFILFPAATFAARLYLEPASGQYQPGDTFIVEIKLDSEQEYINAVEANLEFPQDILEAVDFSQGNSILTLWVKTPSTTNIDTKDHEGIILFVGGIPGGYEGTDGLLGKTVFRVAHEIDTKLTHETDAKLEFLNTSQVLLNDGLGTKAKLTSKGATFTILPEIPEIPKDEWQKEIEKDKIPPEPFEIEISKEPLIFEGKWFIAFSTTDKQTGVDFYEIKEGDKAWKKDFSPYLLEDQCLSCIIKVKAVDKAGNIRIAEYTPLEIPEKPFPWLEIILILIGVGIIIWVVKKYLTS